MEKGLLKISDIELGALALKQMYAAHGYRKFKMSHFEELEFYTENRSFLEDDRVTAFSDPSGKVLALRPDVTLYEESLPSDAWEGATMALAKADVFIIGGTSLTVYPANTLTRYFRGKHLIIMNRDETQQDRYAEIVFHEGLGEIFRRLK